ncbi:TPA: hypothetical protein ACF3RY_007059 [Pseudomonas aeruginosa]|uniref:hypothetical protein n=1 Tax=Providencia TaxID=586 RepID=UPI0018C7974B|nr:MULTISPECIES: hypothetical protein [Providencia]EJD6043709.1 hypothetical protein [Providencia rettgeri]ELR5276760.1 hypothetical protein [Providencia rettgeri]ELR5278891.1 hypothetical protein [Providencia rettgeri]MBG5918975.1 hypothetical protein [Providencia stuartii]UYV43211.1 hypothetical protein NTP67_08170 [Providencia rettgeri]
MSVTSEGSRLKDQILSARDRINKDKLKNIAYESEAKSKATQDDRNRGNLTYLFVAGFFILLSLSALFVLWYNSHAVDWIINLQENGLEDIAKSIKLLDLDKVLAVIIGALGTSLGFIIGYYFKEKHSS